eukprot:12752533-Alexandrium_andersonii.AAC.1
MPAALFLQPHAGWAADAPAQMRLLPSAPRRRAPRRATVCNVDLQRCSCSPMRDAPRMRQRR